MHPSAFGPRASGIPAHAPDHASRNGSQVPGYRGALARYRHHPGSAENQIPRRRTSGASGVPTLAAWQRLPVPAVPRVPPTHSGCAVAAGPAGRRRDRDSGSRGVSQAGASSSAARVSAPRWKGARRPCAQPQPGGAKRPGRATLPAPPRTGPPCTSRLQIAFRDRGVSGSSPEVSFPSGPTAGSRGWGGYPPLPPPGEADRTTNRACLLNRTAESWSPEATLTDCLFALRHDLPWHQPKNI